MDDTFGKIIGALALLAMIVFDWPHAVAGAVFGFLVRRSAVAFPLIVLAVGVVVIAGIGEFIYPLIGRTPGAGWDSFVIGLVTAGASSYGLFRYFFSILDN